MTTETTIVDLSGVNSKIDTLSAAVEAMVKRLEAQPTTPQGGHVVSSEDGQTGTEVKSFGDFLVNVRRAMTGNGTAANRLQQHYKSYQAGNDGLKDLTGGTNTSGGYTIPPDFRNNLLSGPSDAALLVQPRDTKIPTMARSIDIPALDMGTAPTNGMAQYGGVVMTLTGEGAAKTATEPAFKTLNIPVYKLAAITVASDELLADSGQALEALLTSMFRGATSAAWENYFINGTGSGQPLGAFHTNNTGLITVTRATGGNNFDIADALNMKKRLYIQNPGKVAWGMHPFNEPDLINMALTGSPYVTYMPNLNVAPTLNFLGYPVIFSEFLALPGSAGDVVLGDFGGYVEADRQDVTIDMSIHYKFNTDQTTWRVVSRKGGKPWLDAPIPLFGAGAGTGGNAGYTRGHFVKLV